MSKISNAMVETLLEEVTDYANVKLSKKEMAELKDICDRWEDKDSIENEINTFLTKHSYAFNKQKFMWVKPEGEPVEELTTLTSVTILESDFKWLLEHYRDSAIIEHIVLLTISRSEKAYKMFTEKFGGV